MGTLFYSLYFFKKIKFFHIYRGFPHVHWIEKISTKLVAEIILQNRSRKFRDSKNVKRLCSLVVRIHEIWKNFYF